MILPSRSCLELSSARILLSLWQALSYWFGQAGKGASSAEGAENPPFMLPLLDNGKTINENIMEN